MSRLFNALAEVVPAFQIVPGLILRILRSKAQHRFKSSNAANLIDYGGWFGSFALEIRAIDM
jgi:hypothetical protein